VNDGRRKPLKNAVVQVSPEMRPFALVAKNLLVQENADSKCDSLRHANVFFPPGSFVANEEATATGVLLKRRGHDGLYRKGLHQIRVDQRTHAGGAPQLRFVNRERPRPMGRRDHVAKETCLFATRL